MMYDHYIAVLSFLQSCGAGYANYTADTGYNVARALHTGEFIVVINNAFTVVGFACYALRPGGEVFVLECGATEDGVLREMIRQFKQRHPGVTAARYFHRVVSNKAIRSVRVRGHHERTIVPARSH